MSTMPATTNLRCSYQTLARRSSERRSFQTAIAVQSNPKTVQRCGRITCRATSDEDGHDLSLGRREILQVATVSTFLGSLGLDASPAQASTTEFCDEACLAALEKTSMVTTASGLQYKDVIVGDGPLVKIGYQVVADYVGLVKFGANSGKGPGLAVFESTLSRGMPADIRVTGDPETCNVIPGLDEGLSTMRVGGVRRLYVPGSLAFPKGLSAAPGRPRVAPNSDVVFDVKLLYIPGVEEEDDEEYDLADLVFEED